MIKYTYHTSHNYTENGISINAITQLYQIGVYMIVNGDPALQFNFTPNQIIRFEKKLLKAEKEGKIKDLQFGTEITVVKDENGFYKEVRDE